jgi:hypothetical protein
MTKKRSPNKYYSAGRFSAPESELEFLRYFEILGMFFRASLENSSNSESVIFPVTALLLELFLLFLGV